MPTPEREQQQAPRLSRVVRAAAATSQPQRRRLLARQASGVVQEEAAGAASRPATEMSPEELAETLAPMLSRAAAEAREARSWAGQAHLGLTARARGFPARAEAAAEDIRPVRVVQEPQVAHLAAAEVAAQEAPTSAALVALAAGASAGSGTPSRVTLHLIALPHTRVTSEFVGCAYTSKALKFVKMMNGHEDVILYAPEGSDEAWPTETVSVISDAERVEIFGEDDPNRLPSWPSFEQTELFNISASIQLSRRWSPGDLVLLTGGVTHGEIVKLGPPGAIYCEPGVGYEGIYTGFCAFESHAWRHYVYAKQGIVDGRWFDTVIPNYFDVEEFEPVENPTRDYLAFLGRIVPRKGPQVALDIASRAGLPLHVAGAGATEVSEGLIVAGEGTPDEVRLEGDVQYVGPVDAEQRRQFLSNARALIVPTAYLEPFGGVAVEAMLCGTPVIASDWGAFTETVWDGLTGFRFATLREGVEAVEGCAYLPPDVIRGIAHGRYSLDAVRPMFERWFGRLDSLHREGWYEMTAPPAKIPA